MQEEHMPANGAEPTESESEKGAKLTREEITEIRQNPKTRKQKFLQFVKFALFSASAGIIQFLVQSTLFDWTHALSYWGAYPIGLTLSVIWNFTFNRKFTFASAANVPLAMCLVVLYNLIIVVPFAILGEYLVGVWGDDYGMVVTVVLLLFNFVTEFFWDKFIVFNDRIMNALVKKFVKAKPAQAAGEPPTVEEPAVVTDEAPAQSVGEATNEPDGQGAVEEPSTVEEAANEPDGQGADGKL